MFFAAAEKKRKGMLPFLHSCCKLRGWDSPRYHHKTYRIESILII